MRQEGAAIVEARALQARGRSREACERLRALVAKDPAGPARLVLLNFLLQDGRADNALELIESQGAAWAEDLQVLNLKAYAEHQLGRYAEARRSYEKMRELGAGNEGWLRIAENGIASLEREAQLRARASGARSRATLMSTAGSVTLLVMTAVTWIIARRMESRGD